MPLTRAMAAHRFSALACGRSDEVYGGLVTALMRLVFILYAEDRDLMPRDPVYEQSYGLRGCSKSCARTRYARAT